MQCSSKQNEIAFGVGYSGISLVNMHNTLYIHKNMGFIWFDGGFW